MGRRFSLLAALAAGGALLCLHSGARAGVVGSPHDFSPTSLLSDYQTTPLTSSGVCSMCHIPHRAADNVLWPRNLDSYRNALGMDGGTGASSDLPDYRKMVTMQCYDCHDAHVTQVKVNDLPAFTNFATDHKPQNIAFGFTTPGSGLDPNSTMKEDEPGGTESGFYENLPPFTDNISTYYGADSSSSSPFDPRSGLATDNVTLAKTGGHYFESQNPNTSKGIYIGDKLPCSDCHDPHAWDSTNLDWQAFFRPNKIYASGRWNTYFPSSRPRASTYMANDITDLFGVSTGRSDSESRNLCAICHGYASPSAKLSVSFNDINSDYSSTAKIVRPPESVAEHEEGSIVACVSCHRHNSIKVGCNSCHSYPGLDNTNSKHQLSSVHAKHVGSPLPEGTANSKGFDCKICHSGYSPDHNESQFSAVTSWEGLFDPATVNINFDNTWNPDATYADNTMPTRGVGTTGSCKLLYCHGNRTDQSDWAGTSAASPPKWDNSVSAPCGSCHGTGAGMTNANHPAHLDNTTPYFGPGIDNNTCATGGACHTAYGLSATATHVDNTVSFTNSSDYTFANTLVCQNCHSTALVTAIDNGDANTFPGDNLARINWNDNNYKLPCLTCHNNMSQGNTKIDGTGSDAPNIEATWLSTGHGASAIDNGSTNIDNQTVDQKVPVPCGMCHDVNSQHYGTTLATNAWRLRSSTGYNDSNGGLDKFCNTQCHGDLPGSYALNKPDLPQDHTWVLAASPPETKEAGEDTHPTARDVVSAGKTQAPQTSDMMPLDNAIRQSGTQNFLCVTCHDPHGIGPVKALPRSFTGINTAATDNVHMLRYIHDTGSELCKKCHI